MQGTSVQTGFSIAFG